MAWLVVINLFFALVSSVAVTGRITFAFARDGGFPFSHKFAEVNQYFKSPVNALLLVMVFDAFLQLLPLNEEGGSIAFTAIIGLCVIGFQVSYAIPIFVKLIANPIDFPKTEMDLGIWSKPFGLLSSLWLFGTSCLLFFPVEDPVTAESMNWLIVVVGGVFLIGSVNWIFNSRVNFRGPVRLEDLLSLTKV
jgi:amino acid transporter